VRIPGSHTHLSARRADPRQRGLIEGEGTLRVRLTYSGKYLVTSSQTRTGEGGSLERPVRSDLIPQSVEGGGTEDAWLEGVGRASATCPLRRTRTSSAAGCSSPTIC